MKSRHVSRQTLARLRRELQDRGIRHDDVAREASKTSPRGHVGRTMVAHVLAGRTVSANVVQTMQRLLGEKAS
jgi:hypothetical protein